MMKCALVPCNRSFANRDFHGCCLKSNEAEWRTTMITDINSEDRLVQQTFAEYLHDALGWDSVYAWHHETFGPHGTLGRDSEREVVLGDFSKRISLFRMLVLG